MIRLNFQFVTISQIKKTRFLPLVFYQPWQIKGVYAIEIPNS